MTAGAKYYENGPTDDGANPQAVVLLHCSASSSRQWCLLTEELDARFTSMPVNFYGHGNCDNWRGIGPLTLRAEASAILDAVDGGATPFHLIGHSYGGGVALRFALSHPAHLRSLVLIEPSCFHLLKHIEEGEILLSEIRSVATAINDAVVCGDFRSGMCEFIHS